MRLCRTRLKIAPEADRQMVLTSRYYSLRLPERLVFYWIIRVPADVSAHRLCHAHLTKISEQDSGNANASNVGTIRHPC